MEHNVVNCITCNTGKSTFKFCSGNCDLTKEIAKDKLNNKQIQFINDNHDVDMFCFLSNSNQNLYNHYYTGENERSEIPFDNIPIVKISKIE